jgi:hypothetical protein
MLAVRFNLENFEASSGWPQNFLFRHNIKSNLLFGEACIVNRQVTARYQAILPSLLEGYAPHDIYNCDETALFWKCLPARSLTISKEECGLGKQSKERITVLLACNMAGTFLKPMIIGKSKSSRALKQVNL